MFPIARRLVGKVVALQEGEVTTALMMFAYSFLAMTAYTMVGPATRSNFITALGADNLPYVLLASGVLIGVIMQLYSHTASRLPRRWVIPTTQASEVTLLVVFWVLLQTGAEWVSVAFYLFGNTLGLLLISQFWTLANDVFDARQAKRLFGFIGGGASLGGAAGSGITSFGVGTIGTVNVLLVSAVTLAACVVLVAAIVRRTEASPEGVATAGVEHGVGAGEALRLLGSSRHLQMITLVIAFTGVGAVIVGQQLNMAVAAATGPENTDAMTAVLARVVFYSSIAGFLLQVFLTSRIHRTLGLAFALLILPVTFAGTAVMMLLSASLWTPMLSRALDTSLRYNIDKTTREVLFLPLPTDLKYRAKAFIDVTVERFAKAIGAILLLVLIKPWGLDLHWQYLSYATLVITGAWMFVAVRARQEYLRTFRHTIETRAVVPASVRLDVADAVTLETLIEELSDPDESRVLYAIDMLEALDKRNLITPLLLHHESARVRARALIALRSARAATAERWAPAVERMLKDDDADVRAAAVRALAALRGEEAASLMRRYLTDSEPRIAATAAVVLADAGRPEDAAAAEATLRLLSDDTRTAAAQTRREVAEALGHIRNPACRALLLLLMTDSDLTVARAALRSARPLGPNDALFLPALVGLLGNHQLKPVARDVLVSYGDYFLDALAHFLRDPGENIGVRRHIPGTIAAIPTQRSMDVLIAALDEKDGFLRFKVIVAIERLRKARPELTFERGAIEAFLLKETLRCCTYLTLKYNLRAFDSPEGRPLLIRALGDKLDRALDRVYRLLGLIYPWQDIAAARWTIARGDARARARAFEYLDNLLDGTVRRRVVPLLEDTPLEEKVRRANMLLRSRPRDVDDTLAQLVHDPDPVIAASAIHFLVEQRRWTLLDDLVFVRERTSGTAYPAEAAAWALAVHARLDRPGEAGPSGADIAWTDVLPVVDLASRLPAMALFDFVSVDELFRIAEAGRQVRHEPGRALYAEGAQPNEIQFLLKGRVRLESSDGPPSERAAPVALAFEEMLEGRPLRWSVRAVDSAIVLALDAERFFTMLSDNIMLAQGLFKLLLRAPTARQWQTVYVPSAESVPVDTRSGVLQALDKVILLRQNPLLAQATVQQLLAVGAIAREVPLEPGAVLFADGEGPAIYHVLSGRVRLEAELEAPIEAGPRATIGVAETLAGVAIGPRAVVVEQGRALRIDRDELLNVLADHVDLLQGIFSGLLRAVHMESSSLGARPGT